MTRSSAILTPKNSLTEFNFESTSSSDIFWRKFFKASFLYLITLISLFDFIIPLSPLSGKSKSFFFNFFLFQFTFYFKLQILKIVVSLHYFSNISLFIGFYYNSIEYYTFLAAVSERDIDLNIPCLNLGRVSIHGFSIFRILN